jgi:hypothetical protein
MLAYKSIILSSDYKSMHIKMSENKYLKTTSPWRTSTAFDPAKRTLKQTIIEQDTLNFHAGLERALPAHRVESDQWWD